MDDAFQTKRRWFEHPLWWSLLYVLLLTMALSWLAVKMEHAERQRAVVEEIENLGAVVWYDYQFDANGMPKTREEDPPGPAWLRRLLGNDFFVTVNKLDIKQTEIGDDGLKHLEVLTDVQWLSLGNRVTDAGLEHLKALYQIHTLNLRTTRITDAGLAHLAALPRLQSLDLGGLEITDAGLERLKDLPKLKSLFLGNTKVTGEGVNKFLQAVPGCKVDY